MMSPQAHNGRQAIPEPSSEPRLLPGPQYDTIDGNQAAAHVAYRTNEVIAIYPITPSSPMGEWADEWSATGLTNLWGAVPTVIEMQSEGGAAGAVHGALQVGSLTTTFTSSQGLLLMLPNMYKIAGELTAAVFHIAARSVAAQALSIFGDHSDVMAARATGWAMLFGSSVQEAHDLALVAQASTLRSRIPFLHVFDGFRTSHELNKLQLMSDDVLHAMIDDGLVAAHRHRRLTPDSPFIRGTAQNPDTFFQGREAVNPYYTALPDIVQGEMDRFASLTGRRYGLYEYHGAADAEAVLVLMGSGAETAQETVSYLNARGARLGVVNVRLFRPFAASAFMSALPPTVRVIGVLDRTKEPGSAGEPLFQDVITAVTEAHADGTVPFRAPRILGGRYGLASKEFTPGMVKAVFDELVRPLPKNHFTIGINDDVSGTSLDVDADFDIEDDAVVRAIFWGLGADGTVGANKNTVKILGADSGRFAQGYFVYDSRKSGARTVSHLRFGPRPIRSPFLIQRATFVACHQFDFLERYDVLDAAEQGATFLLNSPHPADELWPLLPRRVRRQIQEKGLALWVVNAGEVARDSGLGGRINTVMQACFFALSNVLPPDEAIAAIKSAVKASYAKAGAAVIANNFAAVDAAVAGLRRVTVPQTSTPVDAPPALPPEAPEFVRYVIGEMLAGRGDALPVSALPADGTYPSGTTRWEKRNIGLEAPVWDTDLCIQCGKCVMVCPHAAIRSKVTPESALVDAPQDFASMPAAWRELPDHRYVLQVSVEDCTGCNLCYEVCPAHDKNVQGRRALNMEPQRPQRERARREWPYFLDLPSSEVQAASGVHTVRNAQMLQPLFEYSGACTGCGETPYVRLLTQLFGDRLLVANATGCSSIYGGNMPTTPWAKNADGRGPAWSNSLFEDNAEFGLGMRVAMDEQATHAADLLRDLKSSLGVDVVDGLLRARQETPADIDDQRARVAALTAELGSLDDERARWLEPVLGALVRKSVWLLGGDGWAYDIGYGGLDHVLASGRNVNALVLDTEVYSNTGGQASKATPFGATAKFAMGGKASGKKDLGRMAMVYGTVYVAQIAMGANDAQTVRALEEAESYPGASLVIAYSPCIAHGFEMSCSLQQAKLAVASGAWPLYRFDPRLEKDGMSPLQLDSKPPSVPLGDYLRGQTRFRRLTKLDSAAAETLLTEAQGQVDARWQVLAASASRAMTGSSEPAQ